MEIVKTGKVSVIITTHYIEEARQANVVREFIHGHMHVHKHTRINELHMPTNRNQEYGFSISRTKQRVSCWSSQTDNESIDNRHCVNSLDEVLY